MLLRTLLAGITAVLSIEFAAAEPPVDFNRDVRPILSDVCYTCHGPDARTRKADLRLDTRDGLFEERDGTAIIAPGDSKKSSLFARITSKDRSEVMPPPKAQKRLTPAQIETLRRWIDQGAKHQGHWAFQKIERPSPPPGSEHPVDAFVRAELARQGLKPSPEADRVTLIRRLSFDLTGLPPKPEEVEAFLSDKSPDAYARLVDRLLASPHFGERMAMFWLDLVRYADSVGYHGDQPVSVYPYRDWVVRAFNSNMRFDRFTIEQLAGDLLKDPSTDQLVAAGYNRLGMMSAEGGVQPKEYLTKYAAERVRNLSGAWLGVTLGCAECHDHKFDPFSMRDFYQLEAFFADIQEKGIYDGGNFGPSLPVLSAEQKSRLEVLDGRIAALRAVLDTPTLALEKAQAAWEASLPKPADWTILKPATAKSKGGAKLTPQKDSAILVSGKKTGTDTYVVTAKLPRGTYTALRLEALPHDSLPSKGPGRAGNGNFVVTELIVTATGKPGQPGPIKLQNATATFEQTQYIGDNPYGRFTPAAAIDGDVKGKKWGWAIAGATGQPHHAVFELADDLEADDDTVLTIEIQQNLDNPNHVLGHFRLALATSPRPVVADGAGALPEIRTILAVTPAKRTTEQKAALAKFYRTIAPALAKERAELAAVENQKAELLRSAPTMLATVRVPPRTIRILPRGNWMDDSGPVVEPAFPAALSTTPASKVRLTRLDLARWIVSPDNPLTARSLVNRLWKIYFGAGLSRKLDDLGSQGEWPTHPELLDFLAGRLIDSGWDVKAVIKLIVTSASYRQSSVATPELTEKDPFNRWLARQSRFRIDAELVRDHALAVSGLLVPKLGGPSTKPYQPPGYWAYLNFPTREWQNDSGEDLYRRGLYTHWQRQYLHPGMLAFDAPSREECTAERVRSNTPLQALVLLNDPVYVEAARVFAERALKATVSDADRIDWLFRRAVSRPAKPAEREVVLELLAKHRTEYRKDPEAARSLLKVGAKPTADDVDPAELAAWTSVARTVLNLHAAITRN